MLFTEPGFLFLFLPVLALLYWWLPLWAKNLLLLVGSIFFYWWGERLFTFILVSMAMNFALGFAVDKKQFPKAAKVWVWVAVVANLGLLGLYKYANFGIGIVDDIALGMGGEALSDPYRVPIHLPIGISFYTFQGLSYVLDVYWGLSKKQRNPLDLGLYIALFPQLIAGPIVRYREIAAQLRQRSQRYDDIVVGAERFIIGLGKKLLIANGIAACADAIFGTPTMQVSALAAWLGLICYAIQLYFDFSGYSDMAIGLGRMFGFRLPENFKHPYVSRSVTELWQRWHITLSNWLRDYLFFPLAGKRPSATRVKIALFTVFLSCGLWHGAAWNFVLWGAWNGAFLVIERGAFGKFLERCPSFVSWAYTMLAWLGGLVLFRTVDLTHAGEYYLALVGLRGSEAIPAFAFATWGTWAAFVAGIIGSAPLAVHLGTRYAHLQAQRLKIHGQHSLPLALSWHGARTTALVLILIACVLITAGRTHNPFLYFQF